MQEEITLNCMGGGQRQNVNIPKGGSGSSKWYIVCCKGKTKVVKESNIGDCKELTQGYESKKEALDDMKRIYPNGKCKS